MMAKPETHNFLSNFIAKPETHKFLTRITYLHGVALVFTLLKVVISVLELELNNPLLENNTS